MAARYPYSFSVWADRQACSDGLFVRPDILEGDMIESQKVKPHWLVRVFGADRIPIQDALLGALAIGVMVGLFLGWLVLPAVVR
jgi:hypothetical protein